ncbi:MAG TPA: hypothetical protein VGK20_17130 [Candidatus Binatia bacterium]
MSHSRALRIARTATIVAVATLLSACVVLRPQGYSEFQGALKKGDALQVYDRLEFLIANDNDTRNDRRDAFRAVKDRNEETAAFQFAWAGIAGRLVQQRGLLAAGMLKDIEKHARRSVELDPNFRDGAATSLLGTMYVAAPSSLLAHGDSEIGLEMLAGLVEKYPDNPEDHLRLAEAYITLNDPGPAISHLCTCLAVKDKMRKDEQKLLVNLFADAGQAKCGETPVPQPKKKHHWLSSSKSSSKPESPELEH